MLICKHSPVKTETHIPQDLRLLLTELWNQSASELGYRTYWCYLHVSFESILSTPLTTVDVNLDSSTIKMVIRSCRSLFSGLTFYQLSSVIPKTHRTFMDIAETIVNNMKSSIFPGAGGPKVESPEYRDLVTANVDVLQSNFTFCHPSVGDINLLCSEANQRIYFSGSMTGGGCQIEEAACLLFK